MKFVLKIPIELKSEANIHDHWLRKHKRRKSHIWAVKCVFAQERPKVESFPVMATLVRYSPRKLDDDNLIAAFKWIRDAIADLIKPGFKPGRADANDDIVFKYSQEKSVDKYVIIILESINYFTTETYEKNQAQG